SEDLATILANLTTYRGRLPMGAPTSPVLSNFALKYLDRDLAFHADQCQVKYSRYADDISFSGVENFSHGLIREVTNIFENHGFPVNRDKVSFMGPKEEKKVTGLVLGANGPQLDDEYL